MKALFLIALVVLPLIFAKDYKVPDFDIDETEANCDNVNRVLAVARADFTRLTNYVSITLPGRISKLKDVGASIMKTCNIVQARRPSLVQLSSRLMKMRMMEVQNLKNLNQDLISLVSINIGNMCKKTDNFCLMFTEIKSKLQALTTAEDPSELCETVTDSIEALQDYLVWLGPAVQSYYIDGKVAERINRLNSLNQKCSSCDDNVVVKEEATYHHEEEEAYYRHYEEEEAAYRHYEEEEAAYRHYEEEEAAYRHHEEEEAAYRHYEEEEAYYRHYEEEEAAYHHWEEEEEAWYQHLEEEREAQRIASCDKHNLNGKVVAFKCLGSVVVPSHTWLDSLTTTGKVQLSAATTGSSYSGTHWLASINSDCSYSFQSLGSIKNTNYQYLDGHTEDGTVGLAPSTSSKYSGTHWQVDKLSDGSYSLKALGTISNSKYQYLDGRTVEGTLGLASSNTASYSGTHWQITFL